MPETMCVRNEILASNTYVCPLASGGECVLIDPGFDSPAIDRALAETGLLPRAVFCTHGHFDHIGSAHHYQQRFNVPVFLHSSDARIAQQSNFLLMAFKLKARVVLPSFELVDDGFCLTIGGEQIRLNHTPGHTPGSSVVHVRANAFTGDTLYRDGVGLVSLPGEDRIVLRQSLLRLWSTLAEDSIVRPGHGGSAPFAEIKRTNVPLRLFLGVEV